MLARSVRRRSIRWPCRCGARRRVLTSSSDSTSRLIASLAAAISAALICAKSFLCSTSRSETVRRASISIVGLGPLGLAEAREQRLLHALGAGLRLLILARRHRRLRQHHGDQLVEIGAPPEEDAERLVEQQRVLVPLHEHRVQRPVEVLAGADAGRFDRRERIEHRARPDRNAGRAQRAGEIDDVLGEAAALSVLPSPTPPPAAPRAPRRSAPSPWRLRCGRCRPGI